MASSRWKMWLVIVFMVLVYAFVLAKTCSYVGEARAEETELTTADKAKIAGGCFLACIMGPSISKDKETRVYDTNGWARDPLPKEVEREE